MARKTKEGALETRKKILESALDVMSEKPFSNVSMNDIAMRVGLSKGAVYWHFKNKNDLLMNLLKDIRDDEMNFFSVPGVIPTGFEDLRGFYKERLIAAMMSDRIKKIGRLLHQGREWPEEVIGNMMSIFRDMTKRELEIASEAIKKSQEKLEIKTDMSPSDISAMISAAFHGLFVYQLHEIYIMDLIDFGKCADFIFDAFEKKLKIEVND
ncbi:MAG: TetR family transcriptional regulator [Synergistaceae bacterium]|nr:TetR family transcriptional regulator [Synergistaceae bacterium]